MTIKRGVSFGKVRFQDSSQMFGPQFEFFYLLFIGLLHHHNLFLSAKT